MNILIQRACEDDAAELAEARNKSFYDDYINFGECPGYNIPVDEMKQRIRKAFIYKIVKDGKIIGDISITERDDGYYWIGCLEIIPEYQNMGIGSKVLRYIEKIYPDAVKWGLETPVHNVRNCCFYEKMGFIGAEDKKYSEEITLRSYEKMGNASTHLKKND